MNVFLNKKAQLRFKTSFRAQSHGQIWLPKHVTSLFQGQMLKYTPRGILETAVNLCSLCLDSGSWGSWRKPMQGENMQIPARKFPAGVWGLTTPPACGLEILVFFFIFAPQEWRFWFTCKSSLMRFISVWMQTDFPFSKQSMSRSELKRVMVTIGNHCKWKVKKKKNKNLNKCKSLKVKQISGV